MQNTLLLAIPDLQTVKYVLIGMVVCIVLLIIIVEMTAYWILFNKAGKPGWYAIIPFYNVYVMMEIIRLPAWYFVFILIPILNSFLLFVVHFGIARSFNQNTMYAIATGMFYPVMIPLIAFDKEKSYNPTYIFE